MTHKTVALMVSIGLFGASAVSAQSAAIKKKDGSTVAGQIAGQVVWAQAEPRMAVIYGKDIAKIDETGVHLREGVMVVVGGLATQSDPVKYKSTKPVDVLKVIMPIAAKTIGAQKIDENLIKNIELTGRGAGLGVGTAPSPNGRVFFFKQIRAEGPAYPLVGELREMDGVLTIQPELRVVTASGLVTVPVASIVAAKTGGK